MPVLKIWSEDKRTKVCVVIEKFNVDEVLNAASTKGVKGKKLFLMDGTLIDEDVLVDAFQKEIFLVSDNEVLSAANNTDISTDTDTNRSSPSPSTSSVKSEEFCWAENMPISWQRLSVSEIKQFESDQVNNVNNLIRIVVDDIFEITKDPGRRNLRILAKRICSRFTVLLDTDDDGILIGEGYNSIFKKLEDHVQYRKRPHKKTNNSPKLEEIKKKGRIIKSYRKAGCSHWQPSIIPDEEVNEDEKKDFLKQQFLLNADKRNTTAIEKYLEETYPFQRLFLNSEKPPTIEDIQKNWPILFEQKFAFWHFNKLVDTDINAKIDILENKCQKIIIYFKSLTENNKDIKYIIEEYVDSVLITLKLLTYYFKEKSSELFIKLEESCTQEDGLKASETAAPHILIIGSNIYIVTEKKIVSEVQNMKDAIGLMFVFYYNFNMAYSKNAIMTLEFLQRYIYKINPLTGSKVVTEKKEMKCRSPTWSDDSGKHSAPSVLSESVAGARPVYTTIVKIRKIPGESLGIVFMQCQNDSGFPTIASFQSRSAAERSDQFAPGDRIRSVNGISTARMTPDELSVLLDSVIDSTVTFELEYTLPEYSSQDSVCIHTRVTTVTVECVDGSLGITLRGGSSICPAISQALSSTSVLANSPDPLVITYVRPDGAAHRSGRIKVGDRLLKIDHRSLSSKTLLDAQQLLKQQSSGAVCSLRAHLAALTVEYGVRASGDERAAGPLLLEVQRSAREPLGLGLACRCASTATPQVYIQTIVPASVADRCGALHVGDQILAVDETYVEGSLATPQEVTRLLQNSNTNQGCTRLQIMPYHMLVNGHHQGDDGWIHRGPGPPNTFHNNKFSTISCYTHSCNRCKYNKFSEIECDTSVITLSHLDIENHTNCAQCHVETLTVALTSEPGVGYGVLAATEGAGDKDVNIVISCVKSDSPGYRCGCLQINDRIIGLNGQYSLSLNEVRALLELGCTTPGVRLLLQTEFDVADKVIRDSGSFTVKIIKSGPDLGVSIAASNLNTFLITDIRRGSAAHRTGALQVGDQVLTVDNQSLNHPSWDKIIDDAQKSQSDVVTLRIQRIKKIEHQVEVVTPLEEIVYTVEISRRGDPLGITVSGSEDGTEPITVTALMPGGLATKTGALHVGDRILEINDETLGKRPLSDTIRLLRNSGDKIKIKIAVKEQNVEEFASLNNSIECMNYDTNTSQSCKTQISHGNNNTNENQLLLYSDVEDSLCSSPEQLTTPTLYEFKPKLDSGNKYKYCQQEADTPNETSTPNVEVQSVTLRKDNTRDDFGFSVSDALNERGVYINRIRRGSPAHISAVLRPYDRILQVNNTKTEDYDCCHIVPLIASAGKEIHLVISRTSHIGCLYEKDAHMLSWISEEELSRTTILTNENTIKKTL